MIARSAPTYSAFASFDPDLPLAPVYLLNTSPLPKYAALRFVITDGKFGSNAADTSEERTLEFFSARLSASSEYVPAAFITSATVFSKKRDCIPLAPTLPISSLSTRRHTLVISGFSIAAIASKEGYAHTLSSCP